MMMMMMMMIMMMMNLNLSYYYSNFDGLRFTVYCFSLNFLFCFTVYGLLFKKNDS